MLFFNLAYRTASWIVSRMSCIFLIRFCSFLVFLEFLSSRIISLASSLRARSIIFESTDRVLVKLSSCFETRLRFLKWCFLILVSYRGPSPNISITPWLYVSSNPCIVSGPPRNIRSTPSSYELSKPKILSGSGGCVNTSLIT
jgi:hypothetical protein